MEAILSRGRWIKSGIDEKPKSVLLIMSRGMIRPIIFKDERLVTVQERNTNLCKVE